MHFTLIGKCTSVGIFNTIHKYTSTFHTSDNSGLLSVDMAGLGGSTFFMAKMNKHTEMTTVRIQ